MKRHRGCIATNDRRAELKCHCPVTPLLCGDIGDFCPIAEPEIVYSARETARRIMDRGKIGNQSHFTQRLGDDERMRKTGTIATVQPMKDFERQRKLDTMRNIKKTASSDLRLMK